MPKVVSPDAYQTYDRASTTKVAKFAAELKAATLTGPQNSASAVFDSATAIQLIAGMEEKNPASIPENLRVIYDEMGSDEGRHLINKALLDGMVAYEREHGVETPADVIEHAIGQGFATTATAQRRFKYQLDSATSVSGDPLALQPSRVVVAILSAIAEAFPVAHYLPTDIGSNEAVLAILTHTAATAHGAYAVNALMDAHHAGQSYISTSRVHTSFPAVTTGAVAGKITSFQATADTCDIAAADVRLIRGRSLIYVQGRLAGREVEAAGAGPSTVVGTVTLAGITYAIGGTINTDTGVYALTTTPAMPVTIPVTVEGFLDYERAKDLIPRMQTDVNTFKLHAAPWHVWAETTVGARTQMNQELGLDPAGEAMYAIQVQYTAERHREILGKARRLSANNLTTYDFDWQARSAQMNRAQCWRDFVAHVGMVSQRMVLDTMDHGITHIYVGAMLHADFSTLPLDLFVPSGIAPRPGIYRLGRLAGLYDVYYTPTGITETATASQVLCLGRATSVARNPFIMGDAVPPIMEVIPGDRAQSKGNSFYARGFTGINPHPPSQLGCAMIDITNLQ